VDEVARTGGDARQPRFRVGVLGGTGAVGQRFIQLLERHPWFKVVAIGASERSAGKPYASAAAWGLSADVPTAAARQPVVACAPVHFTGVDFVFSALDASVAGEVEAAFRDNGIPVFTNARNFRMAADVPLVVPQVNGAHLELARSQPSYGKTGGFICTNANCSTTGLVVALKPIHDAFGIESATVTTMQAISGAGYPGIPSLDILDNVVPFISGEEEKLQAEYRKIMGVIVASDGASAARIEPETFPLSAMVNRVHVRDGHMASVSLKLRKPATPAEVEAVLRAFQPADATVSGLPSAPSPFILVRTKWRLSLDYPHSSHCCACSRVLLCCLTPAAAAAGARRGESAATAAGPRHGRRVHDSGRPRARVPRQHG